MSNVYVGDAQITQSIELYCDSNWEITGQILHLLGLAEVPLQDIVITMTLTEMRVSFTSHVPLDGTDIVRRFNEAMKRRGQQPDPHLEAMAA